MKTQNRLKRIRPKFKAKNVFSFDIEYTRKEGKLIEGCIGDENTQVFFSCWEDIISHLFKLSSEYKTSLTIVVHAGDIAEFPHLISYIRNSQFREEIEVFPTFSGQRVVSLQLKKEKLKVTIVDLFAIFPMKLEKIAEKFAPDYPKLTGAVDFSKRDYCPETDREYLRRDVQATVASYKNVEAMVIEHFGIQLAMTAAGTAMRGWLYSLPDGVEYFRLNDVAEDFCREGYYGAYVHPGKDNKIHTNVGSYDITAAYGKRMKSEQYPVGNPVYSENFTLEFMGMWRCFVLCIDAPLPMCPYRTEHGVFWLGIAGDSCETVLTSQEIVYLQLHGYDITPTAGYYWRESSYVFQDFMNTVEAVESISDLIKQIAKLFRNALYGRFGTKKLHESMIITDTPPDGAIPYIHPETGEISDDMYVIEETLDVPYIQPHWAAFVTMYQRLAMFDLILQCGIENFLGCDTDSVKTYLHIIEERNLPISETEYGKGKIEAAFHTYRSHGPKNYVGVEMKKGWYMKSKGIPSRNITEDMMKKHHARDKDTRIKVDFNIITNTLAMMKHDGNMAFQRPTHRHLSALHSAKWILDHEESFLPVRNIKEIEA